MGSVRDRVSSWTSGKGEEFGNREAVAGPERPRPIGPVFKGPERPPVRTKLIKEREGGREGGIEDQPGYDSIGSGLRFLKIFRRNIWIHTCGRRNSKKKGKYYKRVGKTLGNIMNWY